MSEPCRGYVLLRRHGILPAWRATCISCEWDALAETKPKARALGERHLTSVVAPTRRRRWR
jgi:hypothetical protein